MLSSAVLVDIARGRQLVISVFLVKPVSRTDLKYAIIRALSQETGRSALGSASTGTEEAPVPRQRVLLGEDNLVNRALAVRLLEKQGPSVTTVGSGLDELDAPQHQTFDGIRLDIQMPRMDGLECARRIRANSALKDIPIIAVTAHAMAGDRERFLECGMTDKPIRPELLRGVLSSTARATQGVV